MAKVKNFLRKVSQRLRRFLQNNKKTILKLLLVVALAGAFLYLLLRYPLFRPYLVAAAAAIGTVFAAMPNLISDTPVVRWVSAIVGGLCVGLGTWYTANDLETKLTHLQTRFEAKSQAFEILKSYIKGQNLSGDQRDKVIIETALTLREQFRRNDFPLVDELSKFVLEINPENGHGLYFAGEYWRVRNDRVRMRGHFYRYFATADNVPDSKLGKAHDCYQRPRGYCGERTAWISHLMANDFYQEARGHTDGSKKGDADVRACKFVKSSFENFPGGFTELIPSTVLRDEIKKGLKALKREKEADC